MSEQNRIRKVVILGRDDALWLTANVLWRSFNNAGLEITAVELPSMLRTGDVYPTLKAQEPFHSLLGLKEAPLMETALATFSLGQRFVNWSKLRPSFMHAYGSYGLAISRVPFIHYWVKAVASGLKAEFDDFSINAVAARQGRFFVPGEATDGFATSDYAYHLDAGGYCHVLKQVALTRKVNHIQGRLAEVRKDSESGNITSLLLTNGQSIEGDLFIDASGTESLLLGKAMGATFESWRKWFPCDRLLTTYAPAMQTLPAYSQVAAFRSGWLGMYPLRDKTAMQQIFASIDMTDQEAFEAAGMVSAMRLHTDAVVTPLEAGRRSQYWIKNCIGIGEAAISLDPIDSARMHANLVGLSHLVALFPADRAHMIESDEYNRNVGRALDRIRDYQMTHYKLNQRFDQPLWDHCRNITLPDELAYKLDLFASRGNLALYDDETFLDDDWYATLIGHGLIPKAYDPLVDQMSDGEVIAHFQKMLGFIKLNVDQMQPMEAFLSRSAVA